MELGRKSSKSPIPLDHSQKSMRAKMQTPLRRNEYDTEDEEVDKTQVIRFPDSHISGPSRTINQFDISHNNIDVTKLMDVSMDPTTVEVPDAKNFLGKKLT